MLFLRINKTYTRVVSLTWPNEADSLIHVTVDWVTCIKMAWGTVWLWFIWLILLCFLSQANESINKPVTAKAKAKSPCLLICGPVKSWQGACDPPYGGSSRASFLFSGPIQLNFLSVFLPCFWEREGWNDLMASSMTNGSTWHEDREVMK